MKWKDIKQYDLPENEDALFRIEFKDRDEPRYIVGWVDEDGDILTHEALDFSGGYLCNIHTLHQARIKAMYYIDPREIEV